MSELKDRLDFAVRAATTAGKLTLSYFRSSNLTIETKPDQTPVTRADKESEETLRNHLAKEFPHDAIVGEEFGNQSGSTDYTWYLDPIDGTKSFIRGIPLYGTMMGLEYKDEAVAGVIVFPALNELVYAAKNLGAWWSDQLEPVCPKRARVSKISRLSDAYLSTTSARSFQRTDKAQAYQKLSFTADVNRCYPDCYGHYLVATGRVEIMIDPSMNVWDNAPLQSIIPEHHPRSRRHLHRPPRQPNNPRRQRHIHQRPTPQPSPRIPQLLNETSFPRTREPKGRTGRRISPALRGKCPKDKGGPTHPTPSQPPATPQP